MKNNDHLVEINPSDIYKKYSSRRLISSVMLPSQYQSYSICIEYARDWFLKYFSKDYFNNIHIDGKYAFDDFNKYNDLDRKLKKENPTLAIFPVIQNDHNRNWIDSNPEIPMMMRRARMEGCFYNNYDNCTHAQIIFKTILMNFTYKIRVNTRAEQLDLLEVIKLRCRAGYTQTDTLSLDIHVPKSLIHQIAFDNGFEFDSDGEVKYPIRLLNYLNSHSLIPFLYKFRCANGNKEYFIKVPNCNVHLKIEMPSADDGERVGMNSKNYSIELQTEVEMYAPYAYTYYSQTPNYIIDKHKDITDNVIAVMKSTITDIPDCDEHGWDLYTTTEYLVDKSDLNTNVLINFDEFLQGTDLKEVINVTKDSYINPKVFLNFKIFNDGIERDFEMDWKTLICEMKEPAANQNFIIAVYIDMKYVNDTLVNINEMEKSRIN